MFYVLIIVTKRFKQMFVSYVFPPKTRTWTKILEVSGSTIKLVGVN